MAIVCLTPIEMQWKHAGGRYIYCLMMITRWIKFFFWLLPSGAGAYYYYTHTHTGHTQTHRRGVGHHIFIYFCFYYITIRIESKSVMDPGSCDCCVWTIAPKKNKRIYFYDFSLSMKFVSRSSVSTTSVLVDPLFIIIIIYFSSQKNCLRCHRRYH